MRNLCANVILGRHFQRLHSKVEFSYGVKQPLLKVCGLTALKVTLLPLFDNLTPGWKAIAIKSQCYSREDTKFISQEVSRLLKNGIIELSQSPWRAQPLIMKDENHKRQLVFDKL